MFIICDKAEETPLMNKFSNYIMLYNEARNSNSIF